MSSDPKSDTEHFLSTIFPYPYSEGVSDFGSVVKMAERLLSDHVENGSFCQPVRLIKHIYGARVGIHIPLKEGSNSGINTTGAWVLVSASETDPIAFDLAVNVAAHDLSHGSRCKKPLAQFVAKLLNGEISRPQKQGRSPAENWARDFWICHTIELLQEGCSSEFTATRNDVSSATSYCDAVVSALNILGIRMSYDAVKMIWRKGNQRGGARGFLRDMRRFNRTVSGGDFLFRWSVGAK